MAADELIDKATERKNTCTHTKGKNKHGVENPSIKYIFEWTIFIRPFGNSPIRYEVNNFWNPQNDVLPTKKNYRKYPTIFKQYVQFEIKTLPNMWFSSLNMFNCEKHLYPFGYLLCFYSHFPRYSMKKKKYKEFRLFLVFTLKSTPTMVFC